MYLIFEKLGPCTLRMLGRHASAKPHFIIHTSRINQFTQLYLVTLSVSILIFRDGVSRTGLFSAILIALSKLKQEKFVDVFHAVKKLRKARAGMVASLVSL